MNFFENHYLFSETYIKEYIATQKRTAEQSIGSLYTTVKDWHDDEESTNNWLTNYILPVIDTVGFKHKGATDNKVALYTDTPATSEPVAVLYAIDKGLDLNSKRKGKYYAYKAVSAAKEHGVDWAMLTNGYRWQIYHVKNVSPFENYLEVDIENSIRNSQSPDEAFLLFQLFFSAKTYYREESGELIIEKLKEESDAKAEQVENFLRSKAEEILKDICYGFKENMNLESYDSRTCRMIYEDAITLLFRMLFFGYAESRKLLPCDIEDTGYGKDSFFKICDEAKEIFNSGNANEYKNDFTFWDRVDRHLRIYVDETYNGGLFNNDDKPILRNYRMTNGWLMKCLAEISYQKDKKSNIYSEKIQYKDLSVRNLGSIYEGLLEFNLFIADEQMIKRTTKGKTQYLKTSGLTLKKSDEPNIIEIGDIYLSQDATERKDSGAYYTPEDVVEYIVGSTVGKKVADLRSALKQQLQSKYTELDIEPTQSGRKIIQRRIDDETIHFIHERILSLTIIDSAMGSGHFLVNAAYRLANGIVEILCENDWESDDGIHVDINYWKRMVVENCIYGIDINGLAVTLAKLSLWLISADNRYALSFIDHHLKEGNSIIGTDRHHVKTSDQVGPLYETSYQEVMGAVVGKYSELHQIGSATKEDVEKQKEVYKEAQEMLKLIKKKYDYYLASQYAGGITDEYHFYSLLRSQDMKDFELPNMQTLWELAKEKKFFHWELEFPEVLIIGGFDIAIGNPPYVEVNVNDYVVNNYLTLDTKNLYSYMIEVTLNYIKSEGYYGYILPLASVSTDRLKSFHEILNIKSQDIYVSNYSTRPAKIFKNVEQRVAILVGKAKRTMSDPVSVYTTKYNMWYSNERSKLFENLSYSKMKTTIDRFTGYPKISDDLGYDILSKMKQIGMYLGDYVSTKKTENKIYYHRALRYWAKVLDYSPQLVYGTGESKSSDTYIEINLKDEVPKNIIIAILNTNLFYWYWTVWSDCRMLNRREIINVPFNIDLLSKIQYEKLNNLGAKLMNDYVANSKRAILKHSTKGIMEYSEFNPKISNNYIREIDIILAEYYGFTNDELDYILNYDICYRMGDDEGEINEI